MNSSATKTTVNIFNIPLGETAKEEFYPYLAYINPKGDADGLMFESFVFDLSSGKTLSDWEENLNRLFAHDGGIPALDSAAADVKAILGLSAEKTFGVYIKAPLPKISLAPFGDINRDGITKKLLDVDDCLKALSVFVSDFARHTVIYKPKNLEIKGWIFGDCDNGEILTICENYLSEQGYKVFKSGVENLLITEKTDFSRVIANIPQIRILSSEAPEFIINCAFSQKKELRIVYDSLYILLNPERFILEETVCKVTPEETPEEIIEETPEETVEETVEEVSEDIPREFAEEILEELLEDIPETQEETIKPQDEISFEITCDKENNEESKGTTKEISLEISITPPESEQKQCPCPAKKCCKGESLSKKQKRALLGAGIAAAALGLAYIVGKTTKD